MNDATLTDMRSIVVDEVFPHAPSVVWKTLVTPELMARWLRMTPVGFEPKVGNRFTYQTTPAGAWDGVIQCEVLEVVPNERLVYTWQGGHEDNVEYGSRLDTVVTWSLSLTEAGCRLRVNHAGFVRRKNDHAYRNMSEGWPKVLHRMNALSDGRDPDAPTTH
jgi:uncharacterized protein YndB with AHSA1/START domain